MSTRVTFRPALLRLLAALAAVALVLPGCFTDRQNEGQRLYAARCAGCHGANGQGLRRLMPPLAGSDYLQRHRAELPCLIRRGQQGPITVNGVLYDQVMPAHEDLTDSQITNLLNYVHNAWGNRAPKHTIREVSELLRACDGSDGR
ncbi:cytochrome c [Hymenobacter gummosus]|uniref:Cytochrome c n=1 Tax=Hymenobacter gummosus TaxID=1776032 RepID=A0A431U5S8_9BACT|nr:cytochrome c [Hymenobacter gummosus]RTQ51662.1 cytochrome c [Hymenobacter gummosus]